MAFFKSVQESLNLRCTDAFGNRRTDFSSGLRCTDAFGDRRSDFPSGLRCTDAFGDRRYDHSFQQPGTSVGRDSSGRTLYRGVGGGEFSDINYAGQTLYSPKKYKETYEVIEPGVPKYFPKAKEYLDPMVNESIKFKPLDLFQERLGKTECYSCGRKHGHSPFCSNRF